jgi:hypothetical protein
MKKTLLFLVMAVALTTQTLFAQVPSYVPTNGLVGYWPFNGNANDVGGNGNNGVVTGASLTTDRFGNANSAYSFDDNSDYIDCGNSSSVNITGSITLSAWINATNFNTENGIISKNGSYDLITSANNTIPPLDKIRWLEAGGFLFTSPIQQGTWLHIVATFDLTTQTKKVYVNGTLFASQAASITSLPTTTQNLYIGSHQPLIVPSWSFNGKLDDIGVWNRALTQQEITNLYNSSLPQTACLPANIPTTGLVGYWPFCGNANDESGNGNNGTNNGATLTADRFGNANSAYSFNGSSNFIEVLSTPSISFTNSYTISGWFLANDFNGIGGQYNRTLISKTESSGWNGGYDIMIGTSSNQGYVFHTGNINTNFQLNAFGYSVGNWYYVTTTFDGNTIKLFMNGILISSEIRSGNIQSSSLPLHFGRRRGGSIYDQWFDGKLDDIGMWNRALTQEEITNLYNSNQCITNITVTDTLIINVGQLSFNDPVTWANNITIAPNPASSQININFNNITNLNGGTLKIINSLGQEVATTPITTSGTNSTMQLATWGGTGMYFVQIINPQGQIVDIKKIILQ